MRKLYIGNKNYSSWSMRPWVLMKQADIPFDEVMVRFGTDFDRPDSAFKRAVRPINPAGTVPFLVDGDILVSDTLAIAEYLAETFAELALWPHDVGQRAGARSICAEMHAGFGGLRRHCGMNIEASLPEVGARLLREQPVVQSDLNRLVQMWSDLLARHGGPMLFGDFCIADAYFAPMCTRIATYGLPVPPVISDYIARVRALPGVAAWIEGALAEHDFVPFDEPYRTAR